jgi:endonuclease-3
MGKLDTILGTLDQAYPDPRVELNYSNPLELLVATILSAQCTDRRVNNVTYNLFNKYRSVRDYANADLEKFSEEIRPTGFYRNKAKNIIRCCRVIEERFGGEIPKTMDELVTLPGVWRKTASVLLGNCFGTPAIVVDTHMLRVSQRLGLTDSSDPDVVEEHLARKLPPRRWVRFSRQMILYGRYVCKARKPACADCGMRSVCSYYRAQVPKAGHS